MFDCFINIYAETELESYNCCTYNSYETILALFKFGEQMKNCRTANLKSSPNKLHTYTVLGKRVFP